MRIGRSSLYGLLCLALAGCASGATPEQKAAASSAKVLTGPEISQLIVGSTVSGTMKNGGRFAEYYNPNGAIEGHWSQGSSSGPYGGSWKIDGDKFCGTYPTSPEDSGCFGTALKGDDTVYWIKSDGTFDNADRPVTLAKGKVGVD